ncbi:MAG TPA: PQQ-binding-like beta-propeller repeat protein [Candidatus Limnocylindrales bacterium]
MRWRWVGLATATAVLLGATGVIAWRVLRPAEVVTPATASLPDVTHPTPGALGVLVSAPLIIDDRIRVFAKKREVWADGPASYHYERSAYWAYRRWPAQVTGVLVAKADRVLVVTAWTDGMLVAIDSGTGEVAWRVQGDPLAPEFTGRRTGSQTVYTPPGLYSAGSSFVTVGESSVTAYDGGTGNTLWTVPAPADVDCRGTTFTTAAQQLVMPDTCSKTLVRLDVLSGQKVNSAGDGVEPVSCRVGHSECAAMRVTNGGTVTGWVLTGPRPVPLAPLAAPGSLYNGQGVVIPSPDPSSSSSLSMVDAAGDVLWTWRPAAPAPFKLLFADTSRVLVLESDSTMVSLDPATGRFKTYASVLMKHEPEREYDVSTWYVSGNYLILERTNPGVPPTASDDAYYFTNRPILLASAGL